VAPLSLRSWTRQTATSKASCDFYMRYATVLTACCRAGLDRRPRFESSSSCISDRFIEEKTIWPLPRLKRSGGYYKEVQARIRKREAAAGFQHWLREGYGVFHISGKAGSGKSTIMKFLVRDERTETELEK
jgi:ABC-type glutathione transport system ATPase component